jgi:hypothetical protein
MWTNHVPNFLWAISMRVALCHHNALLATVITPLEMIDSTEHDTVGYVQLLCHFIEGAWAAVSKEGPRTKPRILRDGHMYFQLLQYLVSCAYKLVTVQYRCACVLSYVSFLFLYQTRHLASSLLTWWDKARSVPWRFAHHLSLLLLMLWHGICASSEDRHK